MTSHESGGREVVADQHRRQHTPAGGFFDSTFTYDAEGNLTSRKLPGAPNDYYEVFQTEYSGADRIVSRALSTDAVYDAADANQARALSRYELTGGLWYAMRETQNGSAWVTSSWTRSALGPWDATTLSWNALQWNLTGLTQSYSGGAARQTASYLEATAGQTLVQSLVDGITQQSITARAGRSLFFQTPRYERLLAYSPLGEPLADPAGDRAQWTNRNLTAATGVVASITMPDSTDVKESYVYYSGNDKRSGLLKQKTASYTGTSPVTYYSYNDRGQLTHQWGGGDYPSFYDYDTRGRMITLQTWRSGTWTGATWPTVGSPDTTSWTYAGETSLPAVKSYMAGTGEATFRNKVRYGYHPNGSLYTREWQRTGAGNAGADTVGAGVTTTYVYDAVSRLQTVDYPAASTMASAAPDVGFTYDTAGRVATRADGAGTTTYTWTAWGQASKESLVTGIAGVTSVTAEVERTFDGSNRPDLLKAKWGTGTMIAPNVDYGFDGNGYLSTIASAGRTVTMTLAGGSMQWGGLTYATSGTTLLTGTRTLDSSGRTNYVSYTQSGTMFQSHTYSYDRDRVTKMVREQGYSAEEMAWDYGYDAKGQVTSADKRFSTAGTLSSTYLAGHQTDYTYDEAGNRLTKKEGGNATAGSGQRTSNYTPNALNQYTQITNEKVNIGGVDKQQFEVTGRRSVGDIKGAETIQINGTTANYQSDTTSGLHYWRTVDHTAPTTPANTGTYESVTVTRTVPTPAVELEKGLQFLPHPTESPEYDADGNLRLDTRWTYEWDAENRLTKMTTRHTASSTVPAIRLTYGYDGLSRRLWKKVESTPDGTTWTMGNYETYLYDGWNLLMRVTINSSGTATARQSYVWGPDLSSRPTGHASWQSAGGVGGLLLVLDTTGSATAGDNFFPLMDRMGNVLGYRRANTGTPTQLSAVFEYDAFGRELKSLGEIIPAVGGNPAYAFNPDTLPFRFSTKFTDTESGLLYYGYRYYDPINGRWINRDPIGERGGRNLNVAVGNGLIGRFDYLGLSPGLCPCREGQKDATDQVNQLINNTIGPARTFDEVKAAWSRRPDGLINMEETIRKLIENKTIDANTCKCKPLITYEDTNAFQMDGAPSIVLCGQCIGLDKIGHFFNEGMEYYTIATTKGEEYAKAVGNLAEGLPITASPDVIKWLSSNDNKVMGWAMGDIAGVATDMTPDGQLLDPAGGSSPADLAANEGGEQFWKDVAGGKAPPVNICNYVRGSWDQQKNPNIPGTNRGIYPPMTPKK